MIDGRPLIVQGDLSLLLDVHDTAFEEARAALGSFAALEKSPEHLHTYRITSLSLWNAASAGLLPQNVHEILVQYSRYEIPSGVMDIVSETMARYGSVILSLPPSGRDTPGAFLTSIPSVSSGNRLVQITDGLESRNLPGEGLPAAVSAVKDSSGSFLQESKKIVPEWLYLRCKNPLVAKELASSRRLSSWLIPDSDGFFLRLVDRGTVKRELMRLGWPVHDEAPLRDGAFLEIGLKATRQAGGSFSLRPYQTDAVDAFLGHQLPGTGFGIVVLPCGAGKTVVGMAVIAALKTNTLIVTTNIAAVHQWMDELTDKTDISKDMIGEYTGAVKDIRPITIATYQILCWRPDRDSEFPHFRLLKDQPWGLIICDEAHLLPAPVFRVVAEIQAVRRLGLTATLVREDGLEEDVFSLLGPKRYDVPWKDLERLGFIARAFCREIRIPLPRETLLAYAVSEPRDKVRKAAENDAKYAVAIELVKNHPDEGILVIGQYLAQLGKLSRMLDAPLITGKTPNSERECIYSAFKRGEVKVIVVSKVANFAIDLPDASVAIQVSGSFGSRQEEAQRLGRILRPKERASYFYSLVTRFTVEEDFAANRRKFLTEQGYHYSIEARE